MAKLPIEMRDIVTPYNISANESADMVVTANNKTSFVRRGGRFFSIKIGIRPFNLRVASQADRYWRIVTFLNSNPSFEVPIHNMMENEFFNTTTTVDGAFSVNTQVLTIDTDSSSKQFKPGQYIRFANKSKLYQVSSHSGTALTLTQPLSQSLSNNTQIESTETVSDSLHPMNGVKLNGLWVTAYNEDFGNPQNRIEGGIMGNIGPLTLREAL